MRAWPPFYRLGDGLVRAESVTHFITQAVEDLKKVVGDARMTLYYSDLLQDSLHEEMSAQPYTRMWSGLEGLLGEVVDTCSEVVWETPGEVAGDPHLSNYACGISAARYRPVGGFTGFSLSCVRNCRTSTPGR